MRVSLLLFACCVLLSCADSTRQRDAENPMRTSQAGGDPTVATAGGDDATEPGGQPSTPTTGGEVVPEMPSGGQVAGGQPAESGPLIPRREPTPEDVCDGQDPDVDDFVDEGVSNVCGGCGGIPPDGCRSWAVNLMHQPPGVLAPGVISSPNLAMLGFSVFEVPNGTCELSRIVLEMSPDDHMGELTVTNGATRFTAQPQFNNRIAMPLYETPESWSSQPLFEPGDTVSIAATGGGAIGAFQTELVAPSLLDGLVDADLDAFISETRTLKVDERASLKWSSQGVSGRPLTLFLGGSRLAFRKTVSYQAIEYFTLSMTMEDDGETQIPYALLGGPIPPTAYRIVVSRTQEKSVVLGSNRVAITMGHAIVKTGPADGAAPMADEPPFQIKAPNPNAPNVVPGEPIEVTWSPLPTGTGPLEVRLNVRNPQSNEQQIMVCTATDPALGMLSIPAERTAILSNDVDSVNQLSLYWRIMDQGVPAPDVGYFTRAMSVILKLKVD